jgi:hypothetical protein
LLTFFNSIEADLDQAAKELPEAEASQAHQQSSARSVGFSATRKTMTVNQKPRNRVQKSPTLTTKGKKMNRKKAMEKNRKELTNWSMIRVVTKVSMTMEGELTKR